MDTRLGIVTERRTGQNRGQGANVRLLQVMITDKNDVQTVQLIEQSGEESNPPNGTLITILPGALAQKLGVAANDGVTPVMGIGGKRIYSIDPATGQPIAEIRLEPDGTVNVFNAAASFTMNPDGTFDFHGTLATFDCDVVANGISLVNHVHGGVSPGGSNTGVPV